MPTKLQRVLTWLSTAGRTSATQARADLDVLSSAQIAAADTAVATAAATDATTKANAAQAAAIAASATDATTKANAAQAAAATDATTKADAAAAASIPLVQKGAIGGVVAVGVGSRVFPRSGVLYAFGDSQTQGVNAASKPYTSGGSLLSAYRWPSMIQAQAQLSSLQNQAIGGSRISWNSSAYQSHFNQMGKQLGYGWTGICAAMNCWNNLGQEGTYDTAYYTRLRQASEACIARALIEDWDAITHLGWARTSTDTSTVTPGWSQSGCSSENLGGIANEALYMPFPYNIGTNLRYRTVIPGGASIQFTATDHRANALFFETSTAGGTFTVKVNGTSVGTFDSNFASPLSDSFPFVVWLDNLPSGSVTIRIERSAGTGNVHFLARGWLTKNTTVWGRLVLYGSPTANDGGVANPRPADQLAAAYVAAYRAAGAFCVNYPVLFVDTQINWLESRDQEPTDTSHLTDQANQVIAAQFANPIMPPAYASDTIIRL